MALNVDLQVLTQPGSTGQQTYSLAADFNPQAVIVWASPLTADGSTQHADFGYGFGTYRGSTVSQRYTCFESRDNTATGDTAGGGGSGALLKLYSATTPTVDLEIDLVSMDADEVVLDWVNLHAVASIRVFMLVLGGSDITDALVGDFQANGGVSQAQSDETIAAGFGAPDLLFFMHGRPGSSDADETGDARWGIGFAKNGENGRGFSFRQQDTGDPCNVLAMQRSDRCVIVADENGSGGNIEGFLDDPGTWPTDGFRIQYDPDLPAASTNRRIYYLALKGTFQAATGANTAPTAGGLPVNQDNDAGFEPKLGYLFGWSQVAEATLDSTDTDLLGFGVGAYDGATEGWSGFTIDDGAATMQSNSQQAVTKVQRNYTPATPTLVSEADGAFSGNNFRLSWNDTDTVAREYQWLALGDAASDPPDPTPAAKPLSALGVG